MPYQYIMYCCNFCDLEYESLKHCEDHEERCDKNPINNQTEEDYAKECLDVHSL